MNTAGSLAKDVGIKSACDALAVPRASFYRWRDKDKHPMKGSCRPVPPLALTYDERKEVLDILHEDQFVDQAPREVYSALLDERPLQNTPFRPISASGSNFNPQNTQCIPVVKIFAFLELERN